MSALKVSNLSKVYKKYKNEISRVLSWFNIDSHPVEEHLILKDVSFELKKGEAIGIIGQNGAGKSTLLKIITGTTRPTAGNVSVDGRIAAILELGMGFNAEFTGRQNAINSLGMMGFSQNEISEAIPEIEEFAEIGGYFDQPVRTYSSGMQMRVAFSVATAFRPEILIVDEALSVGDAYFQHKSFNKILEFRKQGTSLLFVSHDKSTILQLCDRALLLDTGIILKDGDPESVCDYYNALIADKGNLDIQQKTKVGGQVETISGTNEASFAEITLCNSLGKEIEVVKIGEPIVLKFKVNVNNDLESLVLGCGIKDRLGQMMFGTNTWNTNQKINNPKKGDIYMFKVEFAANLGVGSYSVHCSLVETNSHINTNYEWRDGTLIFDVVNVDKTIFEGCMWNEMKFQISQIGSGSNKG